MVLLEKKTNEIYHREPQNIERCFATCTDNNNYKSNEDSKKKCECMPNDAIPITHINNIKFQIFTKFSFKPFTPREPNDFTKHIKILLQWKQLIIRTSNC